MSLQAEDEDESMEQVLSENHSNSSHQLIDETENLDEIPQELVLDGTEMDIDESDFVAESQDYEEEEVIDLIEEEEEEFESIEIESDDQVEEVIEKLPEKRIKPASSVPPLRLLNIAPKPEVQQQFALKTSNGQPLLLLPGGSASQTIKLISPQGQEINLSNYRPITVNKQSGKMITMPPQTKQLVMKKIVPPPKQQFMLVQKSNQQNVKVVQSGPQKTITLQQAQAMGLLSSNKQIIINKPQQKTIKLVPQTISLGQQQQGKIIRTVTQQKKPQKIILKSSGTNQVLPAGQLIQVANSQGLANGQIHQINVPGKGIQYVKFVTAPSTQGANSTLVNSKTGPDVKPVLSTTTTKLIANPSTNPTKQVVLVPAGFLSGNQQLQKVAIPALTQKRQPIAPHPKKLDSPNPTKTNPEPTKTSPSTSTTTSQPTTETSTEAQTNALRPRKPCNCTKSQCLKLYCDCFANGEFCYLCNCVNCQNNLENEETRNLAIRGCLERNPIAFRPKIGKAKEAGDVVLRKHTKGCNCKRSGCLKNYCECYEAKIACSSNCRCFGCKNVEDGVEKRRFERRLRSPKVSSISDAELADTIYRRISPLYKESDLPAPLRPKRNGSRKQTVKLFMTEEVVEATCQCILTISDEAESTMQEEEVTVKQIIEEFGGCLSEIIHCSLNRNNNIS
ncbi:unnamed protein product [Ceutorhynchus assimilis]|uniref:CRC domain-containing protein n=1 Tax=Ceutorhynchus assimilis TaxID=467358 RepID=A0A9N9QKC8_9CUCU|nr:unnamed protein product [Ceutorhynchus assimilis]